MQRMKITPLRRRGTNRKGVSFGGSKTGQMKEACWGLLVQGSAGHRRQHAWVKKGYMRQGWNETPIFALKLLLFFQGLESSTIGTSIRGGSNS